ncbi:MAG: beta-ketoacyl-[acyl-carrier-protein] synthase family protein [Pseudomonadota bacterium]
MSRSGAARIVVTGMGAVSPLGADLETSWRACRDGEGAIAMRTIEPGEHGPPPFTLPLARTPDNPVPSLEQKLGRKIGASLDPFSVYALASAVEALADAGLQREQLKRAAIVFGHGIGGLHTFDENYERFYGRKIARQHPMSVPKAMTSAPPSAIAMEFGVEGPVFAVSSACASSGHAIAQGAMLIAAGKTDIAIVGGSEAIASPGCLAAWDGLRAMSPTTCRPFSAGRDGMAMGEGGACIILESAAHAEARGARVIAELAGTGVSSDAEHWTQPRLEGALGAMREACAEAGVLEEEGLLISTHGTGTPLNDQNEAQAINALFGPRAAGHHVIATKSAHGHLIGASTALQAALGLCALRDRVAPPILNYLGPDPACDLNLVLGAARAIESRVLLVNSFAFGGLNAALVFRA